MRTEAQLAYKMPTSDVNNVMANGMNSGTTSERTVIRAPPVPLAPVLSRILSTKKPPATSSFLLCRSVLFHSVNTSASSSLVRPADERTQRHHCYWPHQCYRCKLDVHMRGHGATIATGPHLCYRCKLCEVPAQISPPTKPLLSKRVHAHAHTQQNIHKVAPLEYASSNPTIKVALPMGHQTGFKATASCRLHLRKQHPNALHNYPQTPK
jgi:hypothetical protein